MKFKEMNINECIKKSLQDLGIDETTEIQEKVIPLALEGNDIIGKSMTGSGKTAAFGIPILQKVYHGSGVQALVLTPTRELAVQVSNHIRDYAKYMDTAVCVVYGGVSIEGQIKDLKNADIVVGTPGRLLDHLSRGTIRLNKVKIFILDEADRMLDMGFIEDIKRIMSALPRKRQTMLFSATMPPKVVRIANKYMHSASRISAQPIVPKHKLKQFYCDVHKGDKISLLVHLIENERPDLSIVFCRTKRSVDIVASALKQQKIEAKAIHSGFTQAQREHVLDGFHKGRVHVLVATNVAARGLDIEGVTHIFNYDAPEDHRDYRHRIGRTARIGREGKAISLIAKEDHESFRRIVTHNKDIQKMHTGKFPRIKIHMQTRTRKIAVNKRLPRRKYKCPR